MRSYIIQHCSRFLSRFSDGGVLYMAVNRSCTGDAGRQPGLEEAHVAAHSSAVQTRARVRPYRCFLVRCRLEEEPAAGHRPGMAFHGATGRSRRGPPLLHLLRRCRGPYACGTRVLRRARRGRNGIRGGHGGPHHLSSRRTGTPAKGVNHENHHPNPADRDRARALGDRRQRGHQPVRKRTLLDARPARPGSARARPGHPTRHGRARLLVARHDEPERHRPAQRRPVHRHGVPALPNQQTQAHGVRLAQRRELDGSRWL